MQFKYSLINDIGKRPINQDSVTVIQANTDTGPAIIVGVCDGMGGLTNGEMASSTMIEEINDWYMYEFPDIIDQGYNEDRLTSEIFHGMKIAALRADRTIHNFARKKKIKCGTTAVVILLYNGRYYVMNIGDSRAYLFRKGLKRLTKDQTVGQRMVDNGEISEDEVDRIKEISILLQCIGMGNDITPEYKSGTVMDNDLYIVCSDGFRHLVKAPEMERAITEEDPQTRAEINDLLGYLVEENKRRGETDNITVAAVRVTL